MKTDKVLWGLLFLGGGIALLLAALGIGMEFELMKILVSILLLGIALTSFIRFRFFLSMVPLAFVVYIWKAQLGFERVNLWLLILASVVLSIGLSIIFQKKHHFRRHKHSDTWSDTKEVINDDEYVTIDSSFGEQTKYVHASNLKQVNIGGHFSTQKVFFDQCQISPEGLKIDVSANFCEITLIMPKEWRIVNSVNVFAGSVKESDILSSVTRTPVELRGSVNFAEVDINYV
jgi:predicted membrane protein